MTDRYAVIGNPVEHSKSPQIHAAFAHMTAQDIAYDRLRAPLDAFAEIVGGFRAAGGRGANVTLPFKEQAFGLATVLSSRAREAGAVNTLRFDATGIYGDNTDGAGLVIDLQVNLAVPVQGRRILLVGAGGAARGVLGPLLTEHPQTLIVANRTLTTAQALVARTTGKAVASSFDALDKTSFDIVINATSASLAGAVPALPPGLFAPGAIAYDMMYSPGETPFMRWARSQGAGRVADGLGMLVEQAAESFFLWRGLHPDTAPVLTALRASP